MAPWRSLHASQADALTLSTWTLSLGVLRSLSPKLELQASRFPRRRRSGGAAGGSGTPRSVAATLARFAQARTASGGAAAGM
mmetsp:Transcript_48428/g.156241  ORF Transcript_48428/g.156241 Transcript_48428/m.156241 type:complete len:82 (+) Transcript_48428:241-486(+)